MSITGISSSALQTLLDSAYTPVATSSTSQAASTNSVSANPLLSTSSGNSATGSLDPLTQDLVALLKDLASGDTTGAKTALTKLQQDIKATSNDSSTTKDLTSLLKDLVSGNTTAAKSDVTQLELDLGLNFSSSASSTSTSAAGTSSSSTSAAQSPLDKLVSKLSDLLNNGSTEGALQAVASYLVQQGQGGGSLVNTSA